MKILIYTAYLLSLSIFASCSSKQQTSEAGAGKYLSIGKEERLCNDSLFFQEGRFVPLETHPDAIMGEIKKVAYDDRTFFITDQRHQALFIFNEQGKFIRRIQKLGRGPGEYTRINGFTLDTKKKQIIIVSDLGRLLYYDYHGNCLKESLLPSSIAEVGFDGTNPIILLAEANSINGSYCHLIDEKHELGEVLLTYPKAPYMNSFSEGSFLTKTEQLRVTNRYDRSIYSINNGVIKRDYEIDFGGYNLPESVINSDDSKALEEACNSERYVYTITNASDYGRYLFFSTNLIGFFVYDKETDLLSRYNGVWNHKIQTSYNNFIPIENCSSTAAFALSPSFYVSNIKLLKQMGQPVPQKVENAFKDIKEEDNPILMLYDIQ